ncbi:MAG: DUF1330 domain-containing protein [Pseudomonadota bacterium]
MTDTPAYFIANIEVTDADEYRKYEKGFFPILKKHGGEFITFDDAPVTFEGEAPLSGRVIMGKFPSAEAAKAWYEDPEYQAISEHRRAGTKLRFLTMVHGQPPRG